MSHLPLSLWYAVFYARDRGGDRWWQQFLDLHFRHVALLGVVEGKYVAVEWFTRGMVVLPLTDEQAVHCLNHAAQACSVTLKWKPRRMTHAFFQLGLGYCVPLAKQLLCLDAPTVWTCRQLHDELVRRGAEVVFDRRR